MSEAKEDPFYVGFAISVWQNSGDGPTVSNWGDWCNRRRFFGLLGNTIARGEKCGISCDFWNLYKEDIDRAASLGSNCFRLSLEWHRLEPEKGKYDPIAIQHYRDIFAYCKAKGLEPFVTLHHFVHPLWFEKLGAFTNETNISIFVEYARKSFRLFGDQIKYWTTFNEPGVMSFAGFINGSFPPGHIARFWKMGHSILNMLRAHTLAYAAMKAEPQGEYTIIGLVHNWFTFEPKKSGITNGIVFTPFYLKWLCAWLNSLWGNDVILEYLRSGKFAYHPMGPIFPIRYEEPEGGPPGCDYFGINYYSRGVMDWKLSPACNDGETMTGMPYALHAQGLAPALDSIAAALGPDFPVYITETGAADSGDDSIRQKCVDGYMSAIESAVKMGRALKGVMWWSLTDNFEWQFGWGVKFGVFGWSHEDVEQKRVLRESGRMLGKWYERMKKGVVVDGVEKEKKNGVVLVPA
jgi:beta-glucosidase/6-phospho-beta-glucosidase/beta-galactosidase